MERRPILTLRRKPGEEKGTAGQGDPLEAFLTEPVQKLSLDSAESNDLQRFAAGLWADRNRWSIAQAQGRNALREAGRAMGRRAHG